MNKTIKIILLIVFTGIIGIGFYAYTSFNGVPWKKAQVAKELERYIENQYNTDVEVVDKFYNFKFDHYGADFKGTHDESEFIFRAAKTFRGINDYYIEGLWEWQLREVAEPIVHDYIERLSIDDAALVAAPTGQRIAALRFTARLIVAVEGSLGALTVVARVVGPGVGLDKVGVGLDQARGAHDRDRGEREAPARSPMISAAMVHGPAPGSGLPRRSSRSRRRCDAPLAPSDWARS